MGTSVIIVAISSMTAIIVAALSYYTTKQREREAEWRKEKLAYQEITRLPYAEVPIEEHDKRLTNLVLAVRRDLKLRPDDDVGTFSFHMIAPYRNGTAAEQIVGREHQERVSQLD